MTQLLNLNFGILQVSIGCNYIVVYTIININNLIGQERYHSLAPMYYRGAQAAIVVYDITSVDTYARAKSWVNHF